MNGINEVVKTHQEILELEARGEILPLPLVPCSIPETLPRTSRQIIGRTIHKAIRQFEQEGCPETFDLSDHITVMLFRLRELGYVREREVEEALRIIKRAIASIEEDIKVESDIEL